MTTLSILLLYGGVFVVGGLGIMVALMLTWEPQERSAPQERPSHSDAVDPIRSLGF